MFFMAGKNSNTYYINHKEELLAWLIVILIIVLVFFFIRVNGRNNGNSFAIYMPDVDGLIVGSPVRTMGIEVGHVTKIKPLHDEVAVKFVITNKTIELPQGTVATVEFSGMAGSKSLELYLPNEKTYIDSSVPMLAVSSPKRLHDAAGLLNEMFKSIGKIIAVSSRFGKKISEIDFPEQKGKVTDVKQFLNYTDEIIDKSQQRVDNLGERLNNVKRKN